MSNLSVPVLDRAVVSGCGCFAEAPPMPMGCAVCGHAPYAHGCPGQAADHEYAQPSGELMAERFDVRRRSGLGRTLPTFEPVHRVAAQFVPVVPAPRRAEPETTPAPTRPIGRTDTRHAAMPSTRPYRPIEPREERAARLALARNPRTRRQALIAARTPEHPPPHTTDHRTRPPHPAEPAPTVLPDITTSPREDTTTPAQRIPSGPRKHAAPLVQHTLTVASGRGRSPDTPTSRHPHPYRWEVAA